jgi:two-component system response regulator NreC
LLKSAWRWQTTGQDLLPMFHESQLIAEGKSNKEIANLPGLGVYTVETHRGNTLQKLNLHSVPELILYAVRKGVIS